MSCSDVIIIERKRTDEGINDVYNEFYISSTGVKSICEIPETLKIYGSQTMFLIFQRIFLPVGYPHSVRDEYLEYQMYDSIQGVCSYLRGFLCTKSILQGAGVGNATATPLAAAFSWVVKDGTGIVGSLLFAYFYSDAFECNIKEWRLLADVFNNIGLFLDMLTGYLPDYFTLFASLSSIFKAFCGLIACATKARISQHFAKDGHLADVIAKENTQETAVCLVGLVMGMAIGRLVSADDTSIWLVFIFLTVAHQWANWRLVKVLVLETLNSQTIYLIMSERSTVSALKNHPLPPTPGEISIKRKYKLWRPIFLSYWGPRFGVSLQEIIDGLALTRTTWNDMELNCWGIFCGVHEISHYCIYGLDTHGRVCISLSDHINNTNDDTYKTIAQAAGYFVYFSLLAAIDGAKIDSRSKVDLTLNHQYELLISKVGPSLRESFGAIQTFVGQMPEQGWQLRKGQSRFGESVFRYDRNKKDN